MRIAGCPSSLWSVAEFKIGLKELGIRLTEVQLEALVDELDADGSGTIDYAELKDKLVLDNNNNNNNAAAAAGAGTTAMHGG